MHKRIMAGLICLTLLTGGASATTLATDYKDCVPGSWYIPAIDYCADNQVLQGNGAGYMEPERTITRAEFVAMVTRLFHTYKKADISQYTDVPKDAWYADSLAMGVQMGIIKGTSETSLDPNGPVTREQAWTILSRVLSLPDGEASVLDKFYDSDLISPWAAGYGSALVMQDRLHGYTDSSLKPDKYITRSETANLLMECFPNIWDHDVGDGVVWDDNVLLLPDSLEEYNLQGVDVRGTLIVGAGMADTTINLQDADIGQLVCWGAHDIYIHPGCQFDEITISRTDGPCIIHWLGNPKDMPVITSTDAADPDCVVVNGKGGQVYPAPGEEKPERPVYVYKKRAYFHDMIDGTDSYTTEYLHHGLVEPFDNPAREGYVFAGWYYEPDYKTPYDFSHELEDKTDIYAKWIRSDFRHIIDELNQIAAGTSISIECDADILATIGDDTIPCHVSNHKANGIAVTGELLLDDGAVVATLGELQPGEEATELQVVSMPSYGNYKTTMVLKTIDGDAVTTVSANLYVAYLWNRGE